MSLDLGTRDEGILARIKALLESKQEPGLQSRTIQQ